MKHICFPKIFELCKSKLSKSLNLLLISKIVLQTFTKTFK